MTTRREIVEALRPYSDAVLEMTASTRGPGTVPIRCQKCGGSAFAAVLVPPERMPFAPMPAGDKDRRYAVGLCCIDCGDEDATGIGGGVDSHVYVAIKIGCLDCRVPSDLIGVFHVIGDALKAAGAQPLPEFTNTADVHFVDSTWRGEYTTAVWRSDGKLVGVLKS